MKINIQMAKRALGMTLVEVLMTMLVLLLVLALSYRGLNTMLSSRNTVPENIKRWGNLERVFDRLEFDFTNLSWQAPVNADGRALYPLMADSTGKNGALSDLTMSRFSMSELDGDSRTRMEGQLVGYRLKDEKLELLIYPTLYLPLDTRFNQPKVFPLLDRVTTFRVEVLDTDGQWKSVYPSLASVESAQEKNASNAVSTINPLPRALRVTLAQAGLQGEVVRIFDRSQ